MSIRALAVLCFALLLASCVSLARDKAASALVDVEVTRSGEEWTAEFTFARDEPGWWFNRSAGTRDGGKPWRPDSWTVLTPGVELRREREKDVLVARGGTVPRNVRVRFRPAAVDLQADYDPALVFTDGSVALFAGAFIAEPLSQMEADGREVDARVTFRDAGAPVLHRGVRKPSATLSGEAVDYVLFGRAKLLSTPHLTAIIDPALPAWFRDELLTFTPRTLGLYTQRLGTPSLEGKPTVMVSWAGPTPKMISQGGSVLPGLVTMRLEGAGLLSRDDAALERARWFIAHETAHFWLGQTTSQDSAREAWIDEGGASLLAYRVLEEVDPDRPVNLMELWTDCLKLARGKPINMAWQRQEHRAYYACGAIFGMVAEAVARRGGGDFYSFWRGLIDANRGGDGRVTRAEWLAEVTRLSGDPSLAADMDRMITVGVPDPEATLRSLFARSGVRAPPKSVPSKP